MSKRIEQRAHAQRSRACTCCNERAARVRRPWPKPDDPDYRGAVCPTCDAAPAPTPGNPPPPAPAPPVA